MSKKQTAHLENWVCVRDVKGDPVQLIGQVSKHPRQAEFTEGNMQVTSRIVAYNFREGTVETKNTIYTLGEEAGQ